MQLKGAEIVLECLLEQGNDIIFGYPGGTVLPIYDALFKYRGKIRHYLTSHEQGASHAADGYARSTGKVGVCLATSGPGATNLVTGIATAYMDSSPIVAITGNVPLTMLGKDSFQEIDITGVTMPITKHNFIVKDVTKLADTIRQAFHIARQGRPGPVLVDIPRDIQQAVCEYSYKPPAVVDPDISKITHQALDKAAEMIAEASKPFIYAGGGVISAEAAAELAEFAELVDAPVSLSVMGMSGLPYANKRFLGMIGMHGTVTSNTMASECDLLIAVGARFSDRVVNNINGFAPNAKILHIDIDPAEINKNVLTNHSVIGDVKAVLSRLNKLLKPNANTEWMEKAYSLKKQFPLTYKKDDGLLKPQYILERISAIADGKAIFTTEVGQHQMWACHYLQMERPRQFFTSGGLGTMGFGLGAAIGAAMGNPGKTVFDIAGDGCFRMNNIELATAVEYELPVIIAILNNRSLGMVRQWQTLFYDERYSHTDLAAKRTDFVKLAEAYKAKGYHVTDPSEVDDAVKDAIACKKPAVINFEINADERVYPMVPLGGAISDFIVE